MLHAGGLWIQTHRGSPQAHRPAGLCTAGARGLRLTARQVRALLGRSTTVLPSAPCLPMLLGPTSTLLQTLRRKGQVLL